MVKDWTRVEGDIRQLYYVQNKPLSEVISLIRERHNFIASERAYRTQLPKWGLAKYSTQACPVPGRVLGFRRTTTRTASTTLANGDLPVADNIEEVLISDSPHYIGDEHAYNGDRSVTLTVDRDLRVTESDHFHSSLGVYPPNHQSQTLLHQAVLQANLRQLVELLSAGCPASVKDIMGNTPLHCAAAIGNASIVRRLVQAGAQVYARNCLGYSPLHIACKSAVVELLLDAGADHKRQDTQGNTPLHLRLSSPIPREGDKETMAVINQLLQHGDSLNLANRRGITPFHLLLELPYYSEDGEPLVQQPTWVLTYIKRFIDHGADPTALLPDSRTPLQIFLSRVYLDRTLNAKSFLWGEHVEYDILHRFLEKGASPLTLLPNGFCVASQYFREHFNGQDNNALAALFMQSIRPTAKLSGGCTLLHELCAKLSAQKDDSPQLRDMVTTVLNKGADPNALSVTHMTPLSLLFSSPSENSVQVMEVMNILLAYGAHPWQGGLQGPEGNAAIFQAIRKFGETGKDIVKAMLRADLTQRMLIPITDPYVLSFDQRWLRWEQAGRAEEWNDARDAIISGKETLPHGIRDVLSHCALIVLAELHLDKLLPRSPYVNLAKFQQRTQFARILNDCRSHGVTVDMKYYDKLVEMCI